MDKGMENKSIRTDWEIYAKDAIKVYPYILKEQTNEEVNSIEDILNLQKNMKILDVCCGYGRHSNELAKRGYQVVGVDISETALEAAKKIANRSNVHITFLKRDVRNLQLNMHFDVAINIFTSFGFFEEEADNLKILMEIFASLRSPGYFLIDIINRDFRLKSPLKDWWYIEEEGVVALVEKDYDAMNGVAIHKFAIFDKAGYREHIKKFRLYTCTELVSLLKQSGFIIEAVYGDLKGSRFCVDSPRLVIIAKKS
jgi:SAM-dependent methyltransferase